MTGRIYKLKPNSPLAARHLADLKAAGLYQEKAQQQKVKPENLSGTRASQSNLHN